MGGIESMLGEISRVSAQFNPPEEKLAFEQAEGEADLPKISHNPLDVVVNSLKANITYEKMINNFPDSRL